MTFRRIVNWVVGLPVTIVAAAFAVANREWISVSLDPLSRDFPRASVAMPLWALFFSGILVGILAGWLSSWLAHGKWRRAARDARLELMRNQREHDRLREAAQSRGVSHAGEGPS
jgi:hypothetical protein